MRLRHEKPGQGGVPGRALIFHLTKTTTSGDQTDASHSTAAEKERRRVNAPRA